MSPKSTEQIRSHCPVNDGLEIFGDKWSLLIVRDIVFDDPPRLWNGLAGSMARHGFQHHSASRARG